MPATQQTPWWLLRTTAVASLFLLCLAMTGCQQLGDGQTTMSNKTPTQTLDSPTTSNTSSKGKTDKDDQLMSEDELRMAIKNLLLEYPRAFPKNVYDGKDRPMTVDKAGKARIGTFRCDLKLRTFDFLGIQGVFFINEKGEWTGKITDWTVGG